MTANKRVSAPWVDPDDAPDLSEADTTQAMWQVGARPVSAQEGMVAMHKASRGRPKAATTKEAITLRLDAEVLASWRATGKGWQTRMSEALKEWLRTHSTEPNKT